MTEIYYMASTDMFLLYHGWVEWGVSIFETEIKKKTKTLRPCLHGRETMSQWMEKNGFICLGFL